MNIQQYSIIPFEVFTIDNMYSQEEVESFLQMVETAGEDNRRFTYSSFKNGKIVNEELSSKMFERLRKHLPDVYVDRQGRQWCFQCAPKFIMYAKLQSGQMFGIHTDTGCEYDEQTHRYSKFTVLTYLNDNYSGGHTTFFDDNFKPTASIIPKANTTLVFDIDLFHQGGQVIEGNKYWIGTELVCTLLH